MELSPEEPVWSSSIKQAWAGLLQLDVLKMDVQQANSFASLEASCGSCVYFKLKLTLNIVFLYKVNPLVTVALCRLCGDLSHKLTTDRWRTCKLWIRSLDRYSWTESPRWQNTSFCIGIMLFTIYLTKNVCSFVAFTTFYWLGQSFEWSYYVSLGLNSGQMYCKVHCFTKRKRPSFDC